MSSDIEAIDQEVLGTIKRHAGVGMAVGILIAVAGILALIAPLAAGLSIAIAVGVLLVVSGLSRMFFAFKTVSYTHLRAHET